MKTKLPLNREYVEFVTELKQRIASARLHAARAVNQDLILLYWDIGKGIVERQAAMGWGDSVVEALAKDLQKAFPGTSGFSARNLWDMRRFYSAYSDAQFLQQAVAELGKLKRSKKLPQPVAVIGTVAVESAPPEFLRQALLGTERVCGTETFRARMPQVLSDLIARIEVENLCRGIETAR